MGSKEFRELLANNHTWPCVYTFKFIMKPAVLVLLQMQFKHHDGEWYERESSKGNYLSVTFKTFCQNPDEVIALYENAQKIEGIMCL